MSTEEASAAIGQFGHIVTRTRSKRNPDGNYYNGYGTMKAYDDLNVEFIDNHDHGFIVLISDTTFKPMKFKDKSK